MIMTSGLMSPAKTVEWETPDKLFEKLNSEFNFTLDVCASDGMQKCTRYFNPKTDGLKQKWGKNEVCWMNPPYGKEIIKWVSKAANSECTTVCLLPARTDTKWFHHYVFPYASEIRFIKGRLIFKGAANAAPFPSMIVIFKTPRSENIKCGVV